MTSRPTASPRRQAFTLFEAMLALGIFLTAVVALAAAIQHLGRASLDAREDLAIADHLESIMNEARYGQRAGEGVEDLGPGPGGLTYRREIRPAELEDEEGAPLAELWHITLHGLDANGEVAASLEAIHNEALYP